MHVRSSLTTTGLRRRPELQIHRTEDEAAGCERWIIFDPIHRRSFRVGKLEHWLLEKLNGSRNVEELAADWTRQIGEQQPRQNIQQALLHFRQNGLLLATGSTSCEPPSAIAHSIAAQDRTIQQAQAWLSRMIVWRMPGFSPDRLLERLLPYSAAWLSRSAVKLWLALALATVVMLALNWQRLKPQLDVGGWILQPRSIAFGLCVLFLTRCIHELGHALICKFHGVRCPDIGLLFILGAPCLYCDVSESWRLPKRSQRAAIAAGGIYAELIVATLAAWCWMFTIDGTFNTLAMQTMLICSVSTVAFNANPLMRFDGYHILADLLDETNLRKKADGIAVQKLEALALATPNTVNTSPNDRRSLTLGVYAVLSWLYRLALVFAIAGVLYSVLSAWNLAWLGRMASAAVVVSMLLLPSLRFFWNLVTKAQHWKQRSRLALWLVLLIVCITCLPIPQRRWTTGWVQPQTSSGVYVPYDANLESVLVADGQIVSQDQLLFELTSHSIDLKVSQRQAAVEVAEIEYGKQKRNRDMHGAEVDLARYQTQMKIANSMLDNAQREQRSLDLKAVMPGKFCTNYSALQLDRYQAATGIDWTEHTGRCLPAGTLLGTVCSDQFVAVLPLNDHQLADVAEGSQVRIRIAPDSALCVSQIQRVVLWNDPWQHDVPETAFLGMDVPAVGTQAALHTSSAATSSSGKSQCFAAIIPLPDAYSVPNRSSVEAAIVVPPATLAELMHKWLYANLNWLAD